MKKIQMTTPLVEMDGDEMTRILWKELKLYPVTLVLIFSFFLLVSCSDKEELSKSSLVGTWQLESVHNPFGGDNNVETDEITYDFKPEGHLFVKTTTERFYFLPSGNYNFSVDADYRWLIINGKNYSYSQSQNNLTISENISVDGSSYYFKRIGNY